jgi:P27 family predicted phage terminase small subunit
MAGRKPANVVALHGRMSAYKALPDAGAGKSVDPDDLTMPQIVRSNPSARAAWKRITEALADRDLLDKLDAESIAITCLQWADYVELRKDIATNGRTYTTEGRHGTQQKTRPEVGQMNDLERRLRASMGEHGLTPLSRIRLKAPEQGNLFDEINKALNGG